MLHDTMSDNALAGYVLHLDTSVPVFVSPIPIWNNDLIAISQASCNLRKICSVCHITILGALEEDSHIGQFKTKNLKMWGDNNSVNAEMHIEVIAPAIWTDKLYLSLLELSILKNKLVSIETIKIEDRECKTLNDLHHLFSIEDVEYLIHHVEQNSSFYQTSNSKTTT